VAEYKKKIVPFLLAVVLCGGILLVCHAQPTAAEQEEILPDDSGSSPAKKPDPLKTPPDNLNTKELFSKMMFAVLLVIALGAAAIYISKKLLPKITNLPGKEIRLIETVHIGPRKAVHLLEIGNQRFLISSTSESITKLADVTDALAEAEMDSSAQETGKI
jgi:flagellar biogenesis protein FliO